MTNWQMYWLLMLDNIQKVFIVLTLALGSGSLAALACWGTAGSDGYEPKIIKYWKKMAFRVMSFCLLSIICAGFIPSTKQMAAIIVVPKIVNNEHIKEIPQNLIRLCDEWIKDKTKKLKGEE